MTNLLTIRFWFNLRPESLIPLTQNMFLGLIAFLILVSIILIFIKRKPGLYRGFFKKLYTFCLSNAFIGAILFFFNYEIIPFFSARFWLGLWALVMIAWLALILKKLRKIPKQKKQQEVDKELNKYLP